MLHEMRQPRFARLLIARPDIVEQTDGHHLRHRVVMMKQSEAVVEGVSAERYHFGSITVMVMILTSCTGRSALPVATF